MRLREGLLVVTVGAVVAACSSPAASTARSVAPSSAPSDAPSAVAAADLEIYAAASLKHVLAEVEEAYEAANPGTTLTISTDSSAALETKIEQGAPADVFLSADVTNPQKLVDAGLASGEVMPFAGNHLTVIVPTGNPGAVQTPQDLARAGLKVVAAGDKVPITTYATQLLENLAKEPGYPADFVARYDANVVSREENVAAIVGKIELGEGDAGIVYVTDARGSDEVDTVAVPDSANVLSTYGAVVVTASPDQAASTAFLTWLAGREGQAVLAEFGFLPPAS